jgi:N-acetylglucosaminyldiphosphoundecaprenol N-acetyl-beta-D-mannosaminyltransferase
MYSSSHKYANILGVDLSGTSVERLLTKIDTDIKNKKKYYIVTPNPEIVMAAQKDTDLKIALNSSEVAIPDGIGLIAANKYLKLPFPNNFILKVIVGLFNGLIVGGSIVLNREWLENDLKQIKGRDLFFQLLKLSDENKWKVYFLGGKDDEAKIAKNNLEKLFNNIHFKSNPGPLLDINGTPSTSTDKLTEKKVINEINKFSPDILFIGISHPRQEKWLYRWYKKLNVKVAMTIGGTFKYFSKSAKLPPKNMDKLGLSWLWRLMTGDQRFNRIFTAVMVFPLKVYISVLRKPIS